MNLPLNLFYRLLSPRLSVIISSGSGLGSFCAATHSFLMPASLDPPLLAFAAAKGKETLDNVRENGEFVVNLPTAGIARELWACAKKPPRNREELVVAGLSTAPSAKVAVPRIKECCGWLECKKVDEVDAGDHSIVVGEILAAEVDETLLDEKGSLRVPAPGALMHVTGAVFMLQGRMIRME